MFFHSAQDLIKNIKESEGQPTFYHIKIKVIK